MVGHNAGVHRGKAFLPRPLPSRDLGRSHAKSAGGLMVMVAVGKGGGRGWKPSYDVEGGSGPERL